MSIARSRRLAAVALVVVCVACVARVEPARAGSALFERFTPERGGFPLYAAAPAAIRPDGSAYFVLVANRLLCTVETATGAYVSSFDLGLDAAEAIERQPVTPITLSDDGKVLAISAAGAIRFFDVDRDGALAERSDYAAPTGAPAAVGLSADGALAVFASGPSPTTVSSVRTRDAKLLDAVPLSDDEAPIHSEYSPERMALSVVTAHAVLLFRHDEKGKLKQTGQYAREGFVGDAYSGIEALGKRGRVVYTVEVGGSALIGLSLKGKQTARAAASGTERFSSPVATSSDGSRIAAVAVSAQTGVEVAIVFFRGEGREIKGDGNEFALDPALGPVGQIAFDPTSAFLAASFPESGTVLLIDALTKAVVGQTTSVDDAEGLAWTPDAKALVVSGARDSGAVVAFPAGRRGIDEASAGAFEELPGAIFGRGDHALTFGPRFYGVASSAAAAMVWSFNVSSGSLVDQLDVGRSTGLLAAARDGKTLVASGGGGLEVLTIDESGHFARVGAATPGASPPTLAPSVAFHPTLALAYVTSGATVWRVDLRTGVSEPFVIGAEGSELTNPAVSAVTNRLIVIEDGARVVRCGLDVAGRPGASDRRTIDMTLDPRAPRVAYDASVSHMWATSGATVRQVNLLTGVSEAVSAEGPLGRSVVLVAPDLLAALPYGDGSVVFFALGSGAPQRLVSVAMPGAYGGGDVGVDPETRRAFVPLARSVVAVGADGTVTTVDDASSAVQVSFVAPNAKLAYPDFAAFPGSVVIAKGF